MISENLLKELQQLNHLEKLRIIQLLASQIAEDEALLTRTEYEVWSPYDAAGAAAILMEMLEEERQQNE